MDWACQPCDSASSTIQSASTPPPWPPIAITAMQTGRSAVNRSGVSLSAFPRGRSSAERPHQSAKTMRRASRRRCRKPITDAAQPGHEAVEPGRIVDDVGAIERRAEHGSLRHFAAIAAADAIVVDGGDRIVLERIVGVLDRQRRTAREPDAGVIAGADILVDAEPLARPCVGRRAPTSGTAASPGAAC